MTRAFVILTGPEEGSYLQARLLSHAPDAVVAVAQSREDLKVASRQVNCEDALHPRLIAFCTNVVVPEDVLGVFTGGAYNFHPGPPDYPGSHAASFAIYDRVERYGVTAHEMEVSVDSGAIVGVEEFPVPAGIRFLDLEILAYQHLLTLFDRLAPQLVNTATPLAPVPARWGPHKKSRSDFERMKQISESMSEDEIRLRWRAFG